MFKKQYVGICGSLRKNSRNMGMLRCAAEVMPENTSLELIDITEIPLYREDMPKPDSVKLMADKVREKYKEVGGSPTLDGNYTVFGQVYQRT